MNKLKLLSCIALLFLVAQLSQAQTARVVLTNLSPQQVIGTVFIDCNGDGDANDPGEQSAPHYIDVDRQLVFPLPDNDCVPLYVEWLVDGAAPPAHRVYPFIDISWWYAGHEYKATTHYYGTSWYFSLR